MPASYHIKFLPSGLTDEFYGSKKNYYELEDGTYADMVTSGVLSCD